jgi:hypothetical protein
VGSQRARRRGAQMCYRRENERVSRLFFNNNLSILCVSSQTDVSTLSYRHHKVEPPYTVHLTSHCKSRTPHMSNTSNHIASLPSTPPNHSHLKRTCPH